MSPSRKSPRSKQPSPDVRRVAAAIGRDDVVRAGWFAAVFLAIYWVVTLNAESPAALWFRTMTAESAGAMLRFTGTRVVMSGCSVVAGDSTTTVTAACLPTAALAVGAALVLSSGRLRVLGKLLWVAVVLAVVPLVNTVRIAVVAWLAQQHSPLLQVAHVHILPMVMVLTAIAVWFLAERLGPHA